MLPFDAAMPLAAPCAMPSRAADASPDLGRPDGSGRSVLGALGDDIAARAGASIGRLSLVARRLWRPCAAPGSTRPRRRSRRMRAAARGSMPNRRGRRWGNSAQSRWRSCGSAASMVPGQNVFTRLLRGTRAPRRQAGPCVQPHPRRRHRAGDRRRLRPFVPTASSTSSTTSRRRRAIRSLIAAKLLGIEPPPGIVDGRRRARCSRRWR